jgi:hypothetical protein
MHRALPFLVVTALVLGAPLHGAHIPETAPRVGEQRFNRFIYKASHNSYERDEPLYDQIDVFNVWQLELDLQYDNGQLPGSCIISVEHYCASLHGSRSLTAELNEIAASLTAGQRFTVIYLEMKSPLTGADPCYQDWPDRSSYRQCIRDAFAGTIGVDRIYRADDFKSIDHSRWPSRPELQRRGKNFMVVLDEHEVGGLADDDFFFGATEENPPGTGLPANTVLVNINGGCDIDSVDSGPADVNDRWLYRAYPDTTRCDYCIGHDGGYWTNAIKFGFNFIATNCVSEGFTVQSPTHSPQPLFVREYFQTSEPQYGTLGYPYIGVDGALAGVNRASPMVDVVFSGGTYEVTKASGGVYVIDKPVVLKARTSAVSSTATLK